MDRTIIELMDDMHLSSRDLFLNYYYAMQSNNTSSANSILLNNPSLANQITNSQNVNYLINGVNEREIEPKKDIDYYLDKLYQDFLVMINNTRVRGDFDSTVQYYPHNLVYYNGKGYYALKEPPIGILPTNTEYWLEFDIRGFQGYGGLDLNLKFNWDNTISYKQGDIVIYRNKMWYALADNTNYEPNLNHYPWVIISMPKMANKTPIQRATPTGYDTGDLWFQITLGDDVIQKKWDIKQQEITPRFASAGFVIGDNIYTTGGITQTFVRSNKTEVFDTVTNTWSAKADAPITRARTTSFSIGNKAYVIGGVDSNGNILDTVEEYDSNTNTWTAKQSLPIPLVTSGIAVNNIGYVIAGETTGNQTVGNAYSYNATTDTWTAITDKLTPTYGHALASDGTNIYVMGGINQNGDTIGLNEAYDIATNTWSEKDDMLVPRSFLSSFFANGSIYAVGGLNSDWYSLDTNEKYNIEENKWTTDTPMNYPRSSLNAMAIGTKGYAIGGINIGTSDVHGYTEEYQTADVGVSTYEMTIDTTLSTEKVEDTGTEPIETWSTKTFARVPYGFDMSSCAIGVGNSIYLFGGSSGDNAITAYRYDTLTDNYIKLTNIPYRFTYGSVAAIGTDIYLFGSNTQVGGIDNQSYKYDTLTDTYTRLQDIPINSFRYSSASAVGNKIYLFGGGKNIRNLAYEYDIQTDSYKSLENIPYIFTRGSSISIGTDVYLFGSNVSGETSKAYKYDTTTNTYVKLANLQNSFYGGGIISVGNYIYLFGGDTGSSDLRARIYRYNIKDNTYVILHNTPFEFVGKGAVNINNNIYLIQKSETKVLNIEYNIPDNIQARTITIPMVTGGAYDYWIDWGDGTSSTQITAYNDTNATHTYVSDGEYTVRLIGTLDQLEYTGNIASCLKEVTKCNLAFSVIKNMFKGCTNLTNVVENIFSQTTIPTTAESVFEGCSKFGIIPVGLFDNMSGILSFKNTFKGTSIINIPTGLFDSNNSVTDFSGVFENCTRLVAIPMNLFKNNTSVVTFANAFMGDIALTELPNTLFNNNVEVITYENVFSGCTGVKELPINLFGDGALSATNFSGALYNVPLTSLPVGLFRQAYSATNYDNVFNFYSGNIPANCFSGDNATYENALDVEGIEEIGDNGLNGLALSSNMFSGQDQLSTLATLGNDALWSKNAISIANQPTQMFFRNTALTTIGNINFKPITETMGGMFYGCTSLENVSGFFYGDNNKPSLSVDITFENSPLTHTSLLNISDSLVVQTPTTIKNLTLGATNLAKLSVEEKMIIINKYWNLVGYDIAEDISASGEGAYNFALDMVQKIKGDSSTQAQNVEWGAYNGETTLYCYVELVNKFTLERVAMYAFEKSTGRFYEPDNIPVQEYFIWHSDTGDRLRPVFLSKTVSGDTDGAILKDYLSNHNTEEYKILEIGDRYSSAIPTSGLQNVVSADRLFYHLSKVQDLTIYGKFKPQTMIELFTSKEDILFDMNMLRLTFENLDLSICTNMSYAFAGLSKLTSWNFLTNLDTKNVEDMSGMFYNCSTLTSMQNLDMRNVKDTSYMYWYTGITEVLGNIIGNKVENAAYMFANTPITKVPTDATTVFGHNNNLTNVQALFSSCDELNNVGTHNVFTFVDDPTGMEPGNYQIDQTKLNNQLFTYCPNIISASQIFSSCKKLGDIPMGVFYHCSKLKDVSFAFAYSTMTLPISSTYICDVLFANNLELEDISYLFYHCQTDSVLTENKDGGHTLFPSTRITNASNLYDGYSATSVQGYENIPFVYSSPGLKDISYMFANQKVFRNLGDMFNDYSTWSWNTLGSSLPLLENCSYMFSNATELTGQGNKLVTELSKITTLTNHEKTFENCTKLSDYNSIPVGWK